MGVTVKVLAQYFENYGFAEGNVGENAQWKAKNGREFVFENVNSDMVMYADDLKSVLVELIANQSDDLNKFEYRDHEVIFHEPIKLKADLLEQAIIKQHDEVSS
jgi:hypothetical protein